LTLVPLKAPVLCKHFERFPPNHFQGKKIVELGSGTGLVGIFVAQLGGTVTLTDQQPALPLLVHNAHANGVECTVSQLDWGGHLSISKEDVDVILCSDCIYDEDLVESLAKTIAALARPDTEIYVTYQHRRKAVQQQFLDCAQACGLKAVKTQDFVDEESVYNDRFTIVQYELEESKKSNSSSVKLP